MNELQVIEYQDQRVLTTQQLAESYETETKILSNNFNNNKERYVIGKHYFLLERQELKDFLQSYQLGLQNENKIRQLYIWTRRGTLLHAKSLSTDKAWEVYDHLVETYFKAEEMQAKINDLSPQLQLLINMEVKQKELESRQLLTDQKLDSIREIVALNPTQWRKDTASLINKMALTLGGYEHIKAVREESYRLLEQRYGVLLNTRLTNKRKTLSLNGVCKSKIDKTNQLDVIADDKKLIEGFVSIIKELAIKYGVDVALMPV